MFGPSRSFLYFLFLYFLRIKDARCSSDGCSQSLSSGGRFAFQKLLEFLFPTSKNSLRERQNMRKMYFTQKERSKYKILPSYSPSCHSKPRILLKKHLKIFFYETFPSNLYYLHGMDFQWRDIFIQISVIL